MMTKNKIRNSDYHRYEFAAEFIIELSAMSALFQHPKATGIHSLQRIFDLIYPWGTINFTEECLDDNCNPDGVELVRVIIKNDVNIYIYRKPEVVWFDVSQLKEGEFGSAAYQAVADYAVNTGRIFIGDPAGLSDIAIRRRTEAMLSSAIKHGGTEHIEPHERQLYGEDMLGIPPLKWRPGNNIYNISSMIGTSLCSVKNTLPEIDNVRYDFATRTFRTGEGQPFTDGMLRAWSSCPRVRAAGAGGATLKRTIFLNTLACAESGERSRLLEQVLWQRDKFVGEALTSTFY
ncbi:TPA: hypothetical protein N3018_000951 [Klebsiella pneumoniae]|uniref:hypothetical protein n=1 Tax=Klebsiella pneumoniae complex TaxID=3390273 RepID=UPI0007CC0D2F|nr:MULTISPECIES: hypothetical protein [Klebsiella]HBW1666492.1 hypothetical protein [Klebsiella quasipneumoniae subsp. similipneumoniae]ELY0886348.1 hypothetical protein [Klebsiella pneumoniae]ELZ7671893.1 hypothetical protein [Klebsiella pneumoniae]MBR8625137.1 hypothetical protein [Klebsiella pneumoniae subsp. pneumoniae]MDL4705656.1 hypothetical protein [Klebsiella pneumoniae]